jgi:hypothetical protein
LEPAFLGFFAFQGRQSWAQFSQHETTGSSSLFTTGEPMPGIDFRLVRSAVSIAEVLELLNFQSCAPPEIVSFPGLQHRTREEELVLEINEFLQSYPHALEKTR